MEKKRGTGACETLGERLRDKRGSVMLLTALALPVLITATGFAADYSYASYIGQGLGRAADMAAVSAVSAGAAQTVGGYGNLSALQYVGSTAFTENAKQLKLSGASSTVTVLSGGVVATVTYSYKVNTFFSNIIGIKNIPVSGSVSSAAKPTTYVNYYILVDASQSMGIGTSQQDMTTLYDRVAWFGYGSNGEAGCQFGCHVKATGRLFTNEELAHNITPTVTLRIDSAVQAVQGIIRTANATVGANKNVKFGLYTIQANPIDHTNVKIVAAPSTDYTGLVAKAATIDLGDNNGDIGFGDTDYVNELSTFAGMLPAQGSGNSPASPLNFVFIITDGVQDTPGLCNLWGHCTGPLDSSKCNQIKAKATVATIYTTYQPIMKKLFPTQYEDSYRDLVLPFASQIGPAVAACATSTDLALEATYGNDIIAAAQALFNKTLPQAARLKQ